MIGGCPAARYPYKYLRALREIGFSLGLVERNSSAFAMPNIDLAQGIVGFHAA
jgi:hypothetical protein